MAKIEKIEMTRTQLVERVSNCATSYRTYFVRGWATLDNGKIAYIQKFVRLFDEDICEYVDKDYVSESQTKRVARELCFFALDTYTGQDIEKVREDYNYNSTRYALGLSL